MGGKGRGEPHNAFGATKQERFLQALAETCNVRQSAARAGVHGQTPYKAYRRDPEFAARWMEALAEGYVRIEEKLLAKALGGLARAEDAGGGDDDDGAEDGAKGGGEGEKASEAPRSLTPGDEIRLALSLLTRHRNSIEAGRKLPVRGRWTATEEDTDAALRKQLDALARRLAAADRAAGR